MSPHTAASILALVLATFAASARAESAQAPGQAAAHIDMRVVVPAVVVARGGHAPRDLVVGETDLARGYVDIPEDTAAVVTSNGAGGFALSVAFDRQVVSEVQLRLHGAALRAVAAGSWLHVDAPRMSDAPLRLGYRLVLAVGTRAGVHRWPVVLSFQPGP
jgi:hypothetical protein